MRRAEENCYFGAGGNLIVRKVLITTRKNTAVYDSKRSEMQALLTNVLASPETALQLNTLTGSRVAMYVAKMDKHRLVTNTSLPEQTQIGVEVVLSVVPNGVTSEDGTERVSRWEGGLREGLICLRVLCRKHRGNACLSEYEALLASLIVEGMQEYLQRLFAATVSVASTGPPAIENMPPVVKPTWPTLRSYILGRGLMTVGAPLVAAMGSPRGDKRPRSISWRGGALG